MHAGSLAPLSTGFMRMVSGQWTTLQLAGTVLVAQRNSMRREEDG